MSYKSTQEHKKHLERLYKKSRSHYGGAYYSDKKKRLIRIYCSSPWLKSQTSKVTRRRLNNETYTSRNKSAYKKIFDYWWELW